MKWICLFFGLLAKIRPLRSSTDYKNQRTIQLLIAIKSHARSYQKLLIKNTKNQIVTKAIVIKSHKWYVPQMVTPICGNYHHPICGISHPTINGTLANDPQDQKNIEFYKSITYKKTLSLYLKSIRILHFRLNFKKTDCSIFVEFDWFFNPVSIGKMCKRYIALRAIYQKTSFSDSFTSCFFTPTLFNNNFSWKRNAAGSSVSDSQTSAVGLTWQGPS